MKNHELYSVDLTNVEVVSNIYVDL